MRTLASYTNHVERIAFTLSHADVVYQVADEMIRCRHLLVMKHSDVNLRNTEIKALHPGLNPLLKDGYH